MNSKIFAAVLAVVFTCGLFLSIIDQLHAAVTCSASSSASKYGASGSVSPGASDLPIDHKKDDKYEGKASVKFVIDGTNHQKIGERIWVVVKEETREFIDTVTNTREVAANAEVDAKWKVISVKAGGSGKKIVTYTTSAKVTRQALYTVTEPLSHSAPGDPWDDKDAIAFGNCGSAADCDGWNKYRPSGIFGLGIGPF